MGFLVCERCGGYYKLQEGESSDDFEVCECNGSLKYVESIDEYLKEIDEEIREKRIEKDTEKKITSNSGFLVCERCGGYYKLQEGESSEDFEVCECNGSLKYVESIDEYLKRKNADNKSLQISTTPTEIKKPKSESIKTDVEFKPKDKDYYREKYVKTVLKPEITVLRENRDINGLIEALNFPEGVVVHDAIISLGIVGNKSAIEPLRKFNSKKGKIRSLALDSIREIEKREVKKEKLDKTKFTPTKIDKSEIIPDRVTENEIPSSSSNIKSHPIVDKFRAHKSKLDDSDIIKAEFDDSEVPKHSITNAEAVESEVSKPSITDAGVVESEVSKPSITDAGVVESEVSKPSITDAGVVESEVSKPSITDAGVVESEVSKPSITDAEVVKSDVSKSHIDESEFSDSGISDTDVDEFEFSEPENIGDDVSESEDLNPDLSELGSVGSEVSKSDVVEQDVSETHAREPDVPESGIFESEASDTSFSESKVVEPAVDKSITAHEVSKPRSSNSEGSELKVIKPAVRRIRNGELEADSSVKPVFSPSKPIESNISSKVDSDDSSISTPYYHVSKSKSSKSTQRPSRGVSPKTRLGRKRKWISDENFELLVLVAIFAVALIIGLLFILESG